MTTRQLLQLCAWGLGVLVAIAIAIVLWAWSVPEVESADGRLVADSARIQTRTLLTLMVGFAVGVLGAVRIVRTGRPKGERRPDAW